ncbi:hypothetical protein IZ6_11090 [Terrihabitans soli]|uniref:Uncharacterized protein n=1 Tax=Terrihabitans soli TaxID=708113 RepID=A0A6S6QJB8_9HYPH|nr:hypothetical protein [Terrihabitans soli]BCJ90374.1 hypothetical protein IZ6_11090 [Terrihabitans soli]
MFGITVPALTSAARTLAGYLTVWLVAKGFIVEAESELVVTAIVTLTGLAGSIYFRRRSALVEQAASLAEVGKIIAAPELAGSVPSAKVVSR